MSDFRAWSSACALTALRMSDIQKRHGPRPLPRPLPSLRAGRRRAQARQGARLGGGRSSSPTSRTRSRPPRSRRAREVVARLTPPVVRVNGADTEWFEDDLALVAELELDALVLPKATPDAVAALGQEGPPVIAIVETAQGLRLAYETAVSPRVAALIIGAVDLGAELGLEPRADGLEILHARSTRGRRLGRGGHPAAVRHRPPRHRGRRRARGSSAASRARSASAARSASTRGRCRSSTASSAPSEREVAWARRVVEEFEASGEGVLRGERRDDRPAGRRAGAADPGEKGARAMSETDAEGLARAVLRGLRRSATSSAAGSAAPSPRWTTSGSPA